MIDSSGNKILPKKESGDVNFILSEIRFIMKKFNSGFDDMKARNAAERIKKFLKLNGDVTEIERMLEMLESYSENSKSTDFLWELVYIRRIMASLETDTYGQSSHVAVNKHISAKHFDKICAIKPTLYYRCCRVIEYANAASSYIDVLNKERKEAAEETLQKAETLFWEIEESPEEVYYEAGRFLYFIKSFYIDIYCENKEGKFEAISKCLHYSRICYNLNKTDAALRSYALAYVNYATDSQFCFNEDERMELKKLIARSEVSVILGNDNLRSILNRLKACLKKFESE